jgi:hypothetical protein
MKVSISYADIDPLKSQLLALAPAVKASHRVEAMARGFGFGSHAALLAAVGDNPAACAVDNSAFGAFLRERGGADLPYDTLSEAVVRTKFADSRTAIEAVMDREPALCANGLRSYDRRLSLADNTANFQRWRQEMLEAHCVEQFIRAVAYLETREKSKTVTRSATSYGYKHDAERFHRAAAPGEDPYIANGMFIAAALHLGFMVKRDADNSPNVLINIATPKTPRQRSELAGSMRGPRKKAAWRNMMVAAVNAGLDQGLFGLAEDDNRWGTEYGIYRFDFDALPAIACVRDIGHGELSVQVAINPTDRADDFIRTHNAGYVAGDAFASGWLERKLGAWLQTQANPTGSVRTALLDRIIATRPNPQGFADSGRTML